MRELPNNVSAREIAEGCSKRQKTRLGPIVSWRGYTGDVMRLSRHAQVCVRKTRRRTRRSAALPSFDRAASIASLSRRIYCCMTIWTLNSIAASQRQQCGD